MEPVVGIFATRKQTEEAWRQLCERGVEQITLLTPGDWKKKLDHVRTEDLEQRGMGAALFSVVGGALGVAGGLELGVLAAAVLRAGADMAFAVELMVAAILGAGCAAAGMAAGRAFEIRLSDGLSKGDLSIYEGALRQGRCVVIAYVTKAAPAAAVREVMLRAGAESLDAACKGWRFRRQPAEEKSYKATA